MSGSTLRNKAFFGVFLFIAPCLGLLGSKQSPETEIAAVLDDFHDAAARADEERYFGHFAPGAVFLGTDATERWTLVEFRAWAKPHFRGDSAWRFISTEKHIDLDESGNFAWFDEVVTSEHLGACRGTGVLRRISGEWKISQYNLTVPVPNDIVGDVVATIRRRDRGRPLTPTRIFLVRHAEKTLDAVGDPPLTPKGHRNAKELSRLLRDVPLAAIYTTPTRRTRQTIEPLAGAQGVTPTIQGPGEVAALVAEISEKHAGQNVLICGHSNTIPQIIRDLGISGPMEIADLEYDNLFLVTRPPVGTPALTRLRFGEP